MAMIAACLSALPVMIGAIEKDAGTGITMILKELFRAFRKSVGFSMSDDPKAHKAKLQLAELHQILLLKQENHSLSKEDADWLDSTREHFEKHRGEISFEKIKLGIAISRLSEKEYVSTVTNQPLTVVSLFMAKRTISKTA